VTAGGKNFEGDVLVSCIPVNLLTKMHNGIDGHIVACGRGLRYNNIMIAAATVKEDHAGDNFAFMTADREVIFHRLSKLDFLGEVYHRDGTATYLMEYTYRDDDPLKDWDDDKLRGTFADGLQKIGFIRSQEEIISFTLKRFPFAYVIYDLSHKENMSSIRSYFREQGVFLNGRFGNFEYWNMDAVVAESRKTAAKIMEARITV